MSDQIDNHEVSNVAISNHCVNPVMFAVISMMILGFSLNLMFWADPASACNKAYRNVAQNEQEQESDSPPDLQPSLEAINALIQQLGDEHYIVRDEAENELLKIGGPAIEPLRIATTMSGIDKPDG